MADEATERITILLQAKDRDLARAMDRNNKLIAKFERDATRATTSSARNIDTNLTKINSAFAGMAKAGVAAVGVMVASLASGALRNAIASVADLADSASRIGIDVEVFQGLQRGFQLAGVEANAFGQSLEIFTQRIGEAANGAGPLAEAMQKNGVAIRNQDGQIRPTLDLLREFAGVIANAGSEAEKMALSNDAFGRAGRSLSDALSGGPQAIDAMITSARDGGYILDTELVQRAAELDDKFDDLTLKAGNFFKEFAIGAGEAGLGIRDMLADLVDGRDILEEILTNRDRANSVLGEGSAGALEARPPSPEALAAAQMLSDLYREISNDAEDFSARLDVAASRALDLGASLEGLTLTRIARDLDNANAQLEAGNITGEAFQQTLTDLSAEALGVLTTLQAIDGVSFGSAIGAVGQFAMSLYDARVEALRLQASLPVPIGSLPGSSGPAGAPVANPTATPAPITGVRPPNSPRLTNIDWGYDPPSSSGGGSPGGGGSSTPQEPAYWDELVQSVQDAQDALDAVQESADRGADALSDMFVGIMDGSMSAKDALRGLLMELAKVQIQKAVLGMASGGGTGGDIFAALGDALTARANGGPVGKGRSYLVGEEGPELFSPGASGMITPNHKMGSSGGGMVSVSVAVKNGNLVPIIEQVSGNVAAKTVGAYDREFNGRSRQATSDTRLIR